MKLHFHKLFCLFFLGFFCFGFSQKTIKKPENENYDKDYVNQDTNNLILYEQNIEQAWLKIESAYQRRSDLIENLVNIVKEYADFEKSILIDVINARENAIKITIDPSNLSPDQITRFQQSQDELSSALSRLLVSVELYPNIKANENLLQHQNQIEQTENVIIIEKKIYNDLVANFNNMVVTFPTNFVGVQPKGYFKTDFGTEKTPTVNFD